MSFADLLAGKKSIFFDTAPIIYFIEAHPNYGSIMGELLTQIHSNEIKTFTSVITIAEVLPRPISQNREELATLFLDFIQKSEFINLLSITPGIAEKAGRLRGENNSLRALDALQIAAAMDADCDLFVTNDIKLKKTKDIDVLVLNDYL